MPGAWVARVAGPLSKRRPRVTTLSVAPYVSLMSAL